MSSSSLNPLCLNAGGHDSALLQPGFSAIPDHKPVATYMCFDVSSVINIMYNVNASITIWPSLMHVCVVLCCNPMNMHAWHRTTSAMLSRKRTTCYMQCLPQTQQLQPLGETPCRVELEIPDLVSSPYTSVHVFLLSSDGGFCTSSDVLETIGGWTQDLVVSWHNANVSLVVCCASPLCIYIKPYMIAVV